ncbi:MAG: hypothetical protein NT069_04065 [Planctomycetota bacterium]|nr:hypothetical protein [Planctomycetota bacterium]
MSRLLAVPLGVAFAALGIARFAIFTQLEIWTGLQGSVVIDGKAVELPALIWTISPVDKPVGTPLLPETPAPAMAKRYPTFKKLETANPATEKLMFERPVTVRVRGEKVEFTSAPRKSQTTPSDFDGLYLSYPEATDSRQLGLVKEPSKQTEWKIVSAERDISRKKHGVDGFQFEIRQVTRFRLEAQNRPGWFLTKNDDGLLCVTQELPDDEFLRLEHEVFYDDLSDGK